MEKNPWLRALIILAVLLLSVELFSVVWNLGRQFGDIILIFFLAWMVAFLLTPVVSFLTIGHRMPRAAAVSAVYLGMLAILVLIGLLLIPPTAAQIAALSHTIPAYAANTSRFLDDTQQWIDARGIRVNVYQYAQGHDLSRAGQQLSSILAGHALALAQGVVIAIFDGVIVLVLSFYMMLDGPRISQALIQVTPRRFRDDLELFFASVDHSFGGYLRASLFLALVYGFGTGLAMYATGIPYGLPVSLFAGVMLIVPLVGDVVAVIPPLAIGLFTVSLFRVVIVLIAMIALQQLVLQVLRPKVMGRSVGLHPLWVLGSFLVGARAAGIWGALFSVPIAAILQTVVQLYYYRVARKPARETALAQSLRGTGAPRAMQPSVEAGIDWSSSAEAAESAHTKEEIGVG
ncbi:MAG: AI-2E family transporter [Dehalococcoidia bacterium]